MVLLQTPLLGGQTPHQSYCLNRSPLAYYDRITEFKLWDKFCEGHELSGMVSIVLGTQMRYALFRGACFALTIDAFCTSQKEARKTTSSAPAKSAEKRSFNLSRGRGLSKCPIHRKKLVLGCRINGVMCNNKHRFTIIREVLR
jgi:hypothetical protein